MSRELIEAERERFSLKEENCYRIEGAWKTGYVPKVYVDKEQVTDISYAEREGQMELSIKIPEHAQLYKKVYVYGVKGEARYLWFSEQMKKILRKTEETPIFH